MLAQLVSVALTASVKATYTKSVSSFNHFLPKKTYPEDFDPPRTSDLRVCLLQGSEVPIKLRKLQNLRNITFDHQD